MQPRLEIFLENENKKQKQKTQQTFYKFDNFCIYIKIIFGNQNENKAIEKQFLTLKQTQSAMVSGSKFKILAYTISRDDAALASKFYERLKDKVKDAMVAMDRPESLDDMIRHNDNPMNSNFWQLFTQLISQLAQKHKETIIAMAEWENHFNKLQHGLTFDENNPDVTENSVDENCNKKLLQNDAGSSQDKHRIYSLDKCVENMVKKLRAIPGHANNDTGKTKRWTFNPETKNFPTKHIIQKHKTKKIAKACICATKNIFGIRIWITSLIKDHGKNVTIAKDIMNYI